MKAIPRRTVDAEGSVLARELPDFVSVECYGMDAPRIEPNEIGAIVARVRNPRLDRASGLWVHDCDFVERLFLDTSKPSTSHEH